MTNQGFFSFSFLSFSICTKAHYVYAYLYFTYRELQYSNDDGSQEEYTPASHPVPSQQYKECEVRKAKKVEKKESNYSKIRN